MNIYENKWPIQFKQLKEIVACNRQTYASKIRNNKHLFLWVNDVVQEKLENNKFSLATKCYWILNGLTDFPKCKECGKAFLFNVRTVNMGYNKIYCSIECKKRSKFVYEKIKQTCLKKYGAENVFSKHSNLFEHKFDKVSKKYGFKIDNSIQIPGVKQHIHDTILKKYGVDNISQNEEIKQKKIKTFKQCYGTNSFFGSLQFIEKSKQTCIEKYGVDNYRKTNECQQKIEKTNLKKYGVASPMQNRDIRIKAQQRYLYDSLYFDSSPELAYYIWLKDNNIQFEYQPNISFQYKFEGKNHVYMPDFKVDDCYVELKGDHFFKDDGTMYNPWDHSLDALYEAKHQCMLDNNVKILIEKDYLFYVDYVNNKYGKDYMKQFKKSK